MRSTTFSVSRVRASSPCAAPAAGRSDEDVMEMRSMRRAWPTLHCSGTQACSSTGRKAGAAPAMAPR
ncbi:Uncharacterised protein [Bordetella pertussis]|nr:Uncharacterised protein [Bordetella pertussis]